MFKKEIRIVIGNILSLLESNNEQKAWEVLVEEILNKKIKFPNLEFIGELLYQYFDQAKIIPFTDTLIKKNMLGSYVITGKILQKYLDNNFNLAFEKACEYMIFGDTWYVCDILAERVFGAGLLKDFVNTVQILESYQQHPNEWIQRSVGIAVHLAAKRTITLQQADRLMQLSLNQITSKRFHVKKGCGWGIETIAKFYPEAAITYQAKIFDNPDTNAWIKKKFNLGLEKRKKILAKQK